MTPILLSKTAKKGFKKLPKQLQKKCLAVLKSLSTDPEKGKRLEGPLSEYFSIRLAIYRIIYKKKGKQIIITVVLIEPRGKVYKRLRKKA